jgi:hypothetical protein
MLAEECPNVRCFGVPLVRPPKAEGGKDPRKARTPVDSMQIDYDADTGMCHLWHHLY